MDKNHPTHARATYRPKKPTFLGLTSSEWGRLNMFLALTLLVIIGYIVLPTLIGD